MRTTTPLSLAVAILVTAAYSLCRADSPPSHQSEKRADSRWASVSVELPNSTAVFPAGEGAALANSQCLICHSTEMVLTQPQRTQAQWRDTINKMRTAYGAPIPADQVDAVAAYLSQVVAREH